MVAVNVRYVVERFNSNGSVRRYWVRPGYDTERLPDTGWAERAEHLNNHAFLFDVLRNHVARHREPLQERVQRFRRAPLGQLLRGFDARAIALHRWPVSTSGLGSRRTRKISALPPLPSFVPRIRVLISPGC